MKAKLPWILLAVSLAFNAFFSVGFIQARSRMSRAHTLTGRAEKLARKLQLDQQQHEQFQQLLDRFKQLRQGRADEKSEFLLELAKQKPD